MTRIGLSITARSPLLLTTGPPAFNLLETMDLIPGNTIRGLLARRYLDQGGKAEDDTFQNLFLKGGARFGFARIRGAQVIPLSARSCKYDGGFKGDGSHGMLDLLLGSEEEKRCSKCNQAIDYFEGYYNPTTYCREEVCTRLITRTAIDPVRGSASHNRLYSQRVIEEGQTFIGTIETTEALRPALEKLLAGKFTAGIGKGRSRGQGWVEVKECKTPDPLSKTNAADRAARFTESGGQLLAVTLLSDAIFQDGYLRDCTAPDLGHLEPLGINPDQWEPLPGKTFAASRLVFGFDGEPWRLPRVPRLAVTGGSVFLYRAKTGLEPDIPRDNGIGWIGENNREGFGQAIIWHPFHYQPAKEVVS